MTIWLLSGFIYFSFSQGLFHRYYLMMIAPPMAAIAGIVFTRLWIFFTEKDGARFVRNNIIGNLASAKKFEKDKKYYYIL